MPKRIPKKLKKERTIYRGVYKKSGSHFDVKIGERVVLRTPKQKYSADPHHPRPLGIPLVPVDQLIANRRKFQKMGIPVAKIKAKIIDESAKEKYKRERLVLESLKTPGYDDILEHAKEVNTILERAAEGGVAIDLTLENLGIDRRGRLKLRDFSLMNPVDKSRREIYGGNFNVLIETVSDALKDMELRVPPSAKEIKLPGFTEVGRKKWSDKINIRKLREQMLKDFESSVERAHRKKPRAKRRLRLLKDAE